MQRSKGTRAVMSIARTATRIATIAGAALAANAAGCACGCATTSGGRCDGLVCAPVCPRDATRDASGRCVCNEGDVLVLGACVPHAVGDAYCGPAARAGQDGCTFRPCSAGEAVDLTSGECIARGWAGAREGSESACANGGVHVIEAGRVTCISADAACPRGTRRSGSSCARTPLCPPGSLPDGETCRAIVTAGGRLTGRRVDLGVWSLLVLGVDGGPGSPELCLPLAQRIDAIEVERQETSTLSLRIGLVVPDEDVSRVDAHVSAVLDSGPAVAGRQTGPAPEAGPKPSSPSPRPVPGPRPRPSDEGQDSGLTQPESPSPGGSRSAVVLSPDGEALVRRTVGTLLEPLRGLGAESSAGAVEVHVRCTLHN